MSTAVIGAPEFRARSGRLVKSGADGSLRFGLSRGYITPDEVMDAEEFFQAQRDIELGRWRWPENPDWVAVEGSREEYGRTVVVVNERTLERFWLNEQVLRIPADAHASRHAGRAYFEAHPERKPWEDASPGEMWILTTSVEESVPAVASSSESGVVIFTAATHDAGGTEEIVAYSDYITDGRRIWPEDAS